MIIREYRTKDQEQIEHCIAELQDYEVPLEPDRVPGKQMAKQYLQHLLKECSKNQGKLFVAESDSITVGFICVWKDQIGEEYVRSTRIVNEYGYISDYMVLEQFRNQGIGRALVDKAEKYTKSLGLNIIRVGVLANNILAIEVYQKLGFKEYDLTLTKNLI